MSEAIEDSFEVAKNELGLDHNETRFPAFAGTGSGTDDTDMSHLSCWLLR